MTSAQCSKARRYGKIIHESDGKFGEGFSLCLEGNRSTGQTVKLSMDDTTKPLDEENNRFYRLDLPRTQAVNLMGQILTLLVSSDIRELAKPTNAYSEAQAKVRAALESLGLT